MRRILIDNARHKHRLRHGQGLARVDLDRVDVAIHSDDDTLLRVDDAMQELARQSAFAKATPPQIRLRGRRSKSWAPRRSPLEQAHDSGCAR